SSSPAASAPPSATAPATEAAPMSENKPQIALAPQDEPPVPAPNALPQDFQAVINIVGNTSPILESILVADMRIVRFSAPVTEYHYARSIAPSDIKIITYVLKDPTGELWTIKVVQGEAKPS